MKVLVLGGTGFLGVHLVRAFLEAGHEVAVTVRPSSPRALLAGLDVEWVPAELTERDSLVAAFRGREVVVHAAGVLSLWSRASQTLYDINVLGTRNVVEACLETGVGRLLYAGSVGIYAGSSSPEPVDERGAASVERFHSFHVTSMCLAEAEVLEGIARGLDAVRLHPTLCLGVGDRNLHSSWAIVGLAFVRRFVVPPGGLNLVDVRDVARAFVLALEKAPPGGNYLVGGENLSNQAYADLIRDVVGIEAGTLSISRSGMRALGMAGELFARVRGVDRGTYISLNQAIGEAMSLYWFIDDARARQELGYQSGPVRPALERQVAWLREQQLMPDAGFTLRDFAAQFLATRGVR